mmetsp:Transcript_25021/g.58212  ORF Transcript_25021/g.58212 Transcript_25021/m.58212 type:complete len:89 (-) Transcript_25021:82-348(-)
MGDAAAAGLARLTSTSKACGTTWGLRALGLAVRSFSAPKVAKTKRVDVAPRIGCTTHKEVRGDAVSTDYRGALSAFPSKGRDSQPSTA